MTQAVNISVKLCFLESLWYGLKTFYLQALGNYISEHEITMLK